MSAERTGALWLSAPGSSGSGRCVRRQPGSGHERSVEVDIQFEDPRSRLPSLNGQTPASELSAALPRPGHKSSFLRSARMTVRGFEADAVNRMILSSGTRARLLCDRFRDQINTYGHATCKEQNKQGCNESTWLYGVSARIRMDRRGINLSQSGRGNLEV